MIARAGPTGHAPLKVTAAFCTTILLATMFSIQGGVKPPASSDTEIGYEGSELALDSQFVLVGPQCIFAWASEWGHKFGFDMAAQGAKAGFQDTFTTYSSVYAPDPPQAPCDLNCQLAKMMELASAKAKELDDWKRAGHPWECDDAHMPDLEGWQEFAHAVGPGLNPFEPTFDDLVNLSSEIGTVNLYCHVKYNLTNASNYAIWLAGYFDGSKQGGATFGLIMLVVDVVTFIIGLPALWSMGKAIAGLLKAGWEALKKAPAALAKLQVFLIQKAQAFATAFSEAGMAIAESSGVILRQVGGSLARAADAAREVARNIAGLRGVLGEGLPITDSGIVAKAVDKAIPKKVGWLRSLFGSGGGGGGGPTPFLSTGELTAEAIRDSKIIKRGEELNDPLVIAELTADGSSMYDWAKWTVRTVYQSPRGPYQVHYYRNMWTGEVNYFGYKINFLKGW